MCRRYKVKSKDALIPEPCFFADMSLANFVKNCAWSERDVDAVSDLSVGDTLHSKYYVIERIK